MKTFLIQTRNVNGQYLPAQSYGYSAIEAVEYTNWFNREQIYNYILDVDSAKNFAVSGVKDLEYAHFDYFKKYADNNTIPIGSVEYVLAWLKHKGFDCVKPLNIPQELWKFCKRKVMITELDKIDGWYMVKDLDKIKSNINDKMHLRIGDKGNDKQYFVTEWIENVVSEWRVFVFDKTIVGVRCYSGNEWILPDKNYIQSVVHEYDKKCYTLDVMVYEGVNKTSYNQSLSYLTDIVELHDFFACGLYGFEDCSVLPKMWITTINELSKGRE